MVSPTRNIFLIGFSGTGKSTVGNEVAKRLGRLFLDTDLEIVRLTGRSISEIFASDGEESFRAIESRVLTSACGEQGIIVATGGGAFHVEANQKLLLSSGMVICLEARPETIKQRLFEATEWSDPSNRVRPLLQSADSLLTIRNLKEIRQSSYAMANWTIHTETLTVTEVVEEIIRVVNSDKHNRLESSNPGKMLVRIPEPKAIVYSSEGQCPLYTGAGLLDKVGELCDFAGLRGTAHLISDENVYPYYGQQVSDSLQQQGIAVKILQVPPGERTKSVESLNRCYGWLAENRAERNDFIVSLGGGVVGDLAGFAAATFNRGMAFVQIPTSLIAMVDSAIGGKTAVNLTQGKNLVGSFHQPKFVIADINSLKTLPVREKTSGWAEAIKHGIILDGPLFKTFEDCGESILASEPEIMEKVISASMMVKAQVVTQDERETKGFRTLLNYGHTIGHALENVMGYGQLLHGEAVAIGMAAAVRISERIGLISPEIVDRQDALLQRFGLPTKFSGMDTDKIMRAMAVDKKNLSGDLRWVLLEGLGSATVRSGLGEEIIVKVLQEMQY